MSYSGGVIVDLIGREEESSTIFAFLKSALLCVKEDYPFRGPKTLSRTDFVYVCEVEGNIARFSGNESIGEEKMFTGRVFSQQFIGGNIVHKLKS